MSDLAPCEASVVAGNTEDGVECAHCLSTDCEGGGVYPIDFRREWVTCPCDCHTAEEALRALREDTSE